MLKVADLFANLKLQMSDFNKGLSDAIRQADAAGKQMGSAMSSSTKSSLKGMTEEVNAFANNAEIQFKNVARVIQGIVISQAFYRALNTVQSMVSEMNNYNKSVEQSTIAFKYLIGSQEAAVFMMNQLQDLAAETNFSTDSAVKAARLMMAYGYSAKETIPILRTMADASAVAGGDDDAFKRAIVAIGQIRAAGTVMKQDLNQLTNAGIPAIQILKEELKLTDKQMKEIGKQKISSNVAVDALMRGLQKRYAGASKEMESTVGGLMNRIKDMALVVGNVFTQPTFQALRGFLQGIADKLEELRNIARQFGKEGIIAHIFGPEMVAPMKLLAINISMLINSLGQLRQALSPVVREFISSFAIALNAILPILSGVLIVIAKLASVFTQCTPLVRFFTFSIVGLFVASKVAAAVNILTKSIRNLGIAEIVANIIVRLASAIKILWTAIGKNPIGAVIMLACAALLSLALSSKTASAWIDRLTASLGRLFGFEMDDMWKPLDPSDINKGLNDFNNNLGDVGDTAGDVGDGLKDVGDKAQDAGDKGAAAAKKMKESFIAAFDEVFQVPDEKDDKDKGDKDKKPGKGDGGGGGGAGDLPPILDFDYEKPEYTPIPPLKWPEIPPFPTIPPIPPPAWLPWAAYPPLPVFNPGLVPTPGWLPWPEFPPVRVPSFPPIPTPGWQPWPALPPVPVPQFPPVRLPDFGPWPQLPALPPVPMIPPIKMPSFPPWPDFPQLPKLPEFPPLKLPTPNFQAWGNSIKSSVEQALDRGTSVCVDWAGKLSNALAPAGQAVHAAAVSVGEFLVQGLASLPSTMASNARELYTQAVELGNRVVEGVKTGFSTVGEKVSSAWETVKTNTSTAWDTVREKVSTAIEGMNTDSTAIDGGLVTTVVGGAVTVGKALIDGFGKGKAAVNGFAFDTKGAADANALSMANIELTTGKAFSESEKAMHLVNGSLDKYKAAIIQAEIQSGTSLDEVANKYNLTKDDVKKYSNMMVDDTLKDQAKLEKGMSEKWENIKSTTGETWDNIKTSLNRTWENVKTSANTKFENIKANIKTAWDNTKSNTSTTWSNIKSNLDTTWTNVKSTATSKFNETKEKIKTAWDNTKTNTSTTWDNIKSSLGTTWETVKNNADTKFTATRDKIKDSWDKVKTNTSTTWSNVKSNLSTTWDRIKSDTSSKSSNVKTTVGTAWDNIKTETTNKWNDAKNTIDTTTQRMLVICENIKAPFKRTWEAISNIVKTAFNGVSGAVKSALNPIIKAVNSVINGLNRISINVPDWVPGFGGKTWGFNIPTIPHFADGGIVGRDTLARIGEGNKREAIIPLENGGAMAPFADAVAERIASRQQATITSSSSGEHPYVLYVGTLIADDRGINELKRKLDIVEIQERRRRGDGR